MDYLDERWDAGRVFKAATRSYALIAGLLVVLSFYPSLDDEAAVEDGKGAVTRYDSGNLWEMAAEGYDTGVGSALLTVVLVLCLIAAAFRKQLRMAGLDAAIAVLASLFAVLLLTKPDYLEYAKPALLGAGRASVAVLVVTAVLSVVLGVVIGTYSHAQRRWAGAPVRPTSAEASTNRQ